ncbi:MAG: hypothetical protein HZC36_05195 [Armatimonadetes bacterium]|nr:hypothetical protein [Armatimonadota bacterium]
MYLISWMEDEARVEASLGGRVTAEEMAVLQDELADVIETLEHKPFLLVLDYAKAKGFDLDTRSVLADLKDFCFANGAAKIVSIVQDEDAMVSQCTERIQAILEGREELMLEPREIAWQAPATQVVRKAA